MSDEFWKVQCSKKVGNDLWNFRGATVYEVQKMVKEWQGEPVTGTVVVDARGDKTPVENVSEAAAGPEVGPAVAPDAQPEPSLTPLEKARQRMAGAKKGE
jgi:hypothetical protein